MRKVLQKGMKYGDIQATLNKLRKKRLLRSNINLDFTNGKGEFGGFDKFFSELAKLKKLDTAERIKVIEGVFGNDAEVNQVVSTLIEKGKAGYEEFAAKMEKQADLRKRVDEQLGTLTNIWEATTGTFTNLLAEIGATIAPQLKQLSTKLGEITEKVKNWVKANPELTGTLMKIAVGLTAVVGITGALASAFSFLLFPIGRTALFLGSLGKTIIGIIPNILAFSAALLTNPLTWIVAGIAAVIAAIVLLVKNWDVVKEAFATGWNWVCELFNTGWENIKGFFASGIEKITATISSWDPLGLFYKVFAQVMAWFGVDLPNSFSAFGSKIMSALGDGIFNTFDTIKTGIMNTVNWIKEKLGFSTEAESTINQIKTNAGRGNINGVADNVAYTAIGTMGKFSSGGYTGNGGKYQPMGIVHGGEYVMTKEATNRLGIATLNALNYGKQALIAGGLGIGLATAAPIQVDNRPPISARPSINQTMQPMAVNITINAQAGQNERQIAQLVAAELERINRQQQARMRSRMTDRA